MRTKIERGWAGHFIQSEKCRFRRNTLITYENDLKLVVSTVGNMRLPDPIFSTLYEDKVKMGDLGIDRFYETMVFRAFKDGSYEDADVSAELKDYSIFPFSVLNGEQVIAHRDYVDNLANGMHDGIVSILMQLDPSTLEFRQFEVEDEE